MTDAGTAGFAGDIVFEQARPAVSSGWALSSFVGWFFSFRLMFPLLSVRLLGMDPQAGVVAGLVVNYLLLAVIVFAAIGPAPRSLASVISTRPFRWVLLFVGFSGVSLLWTEAISLPAAAAFWCAMAADVAMVVLLLREGKAEEIVASLLKGYVMGACAVGAIAWMLPALADMRIGDDELLGANQIGFACAMALFGAQFLLRTKELRWKLCAAFLAITTLRSLSKTTIAAVLAGEAVLLLSDKSMSRKTKLWLAACTVAVIGLFWGLLASYAELYANSGKGAVTLTGRFGIWLYMFTEGLQKPWIGHGFHSVWKVVPAFGLFEARHAHNELLQQFYVYGVMGVVMLAGLYGSLVHRVRKLPKSALKSWLFGLMVFVVVRGLADTESFDLTLPLWMIVGLATFLEEEMQGLEVKRNAPTQYPIPNRAPAPSA